jgi:hypothetical protein
MRLRVLLPALLLVAVLAPPASAATPVERSADLWATVNVCDTAARPDTVGIRGSMPGSGHLETLQMRFRVQYVDARDGKWHNVAEGADSGFVRVGAARRRTLESGYSFRFAAPTGGKVVRMRGAVTFRWLHKGRTVHRVRELTEAGHRSTRGADPDGFSAATCDLR